MGFALWIESDTAWCAGTHEYRPMGVAVVAASTLFSARDFNSLRAAPGERFDRNFHGLFASLPDVNSYMQKRNTKPRGSFRRRQLILVHNSKK